MAGRREIYAPLKERTVENYQVQYMARRNGPTTYTEGLKKQPKERMEIPDILVPEKVVQKLTKIMGVETGLGKNVSKHLN